MLQASKPESQRTIIPEGTHIARVYGLIHVGTVPTSWEGEDRMTDKVRISFEFPEETHVFKEGDEARPLVLSQEYTLSMGKKSNLRPIVEGIVGTGLSDAEAYSFDHESLVGKACLVTVKHKKAKNGNDFAVIASTAPLMKGQEPKPQVNPSKVLTYQKWDQEYFDSLPDFIKDVMKGSDEYKAMNGTKSVDVSEMPF